MKKLLSILIIAGMFVFAGVLTGCGIASGANARSFDGGGTAVCVCDREGCDWENCGGGFCDTEGCAECIGCGSGGRQNCRRRGNNGNRD